MYLESYKQRQEKWKERRENIYKRFLAGESAIQLAKSLNVCRQNVYVLIKKVIKAQERQIT